MPAKSVIDIYIKAMQSNVLSVNEARKRFGLTEITKTDGYVRPMMILGEEGQELIVPRSTNRIKCEYCGRPNDPVREMCASCGAPLQN